MVTDTKMSNLRIVLHQIYVSLYVEYGMSSYPGSTWESRKAESGYSCQEPTVAS